MNTLIELYDERAIENVLGAEIFKPKRVIYLAPPEVAKNNHIKESLRKFFVIRGLTLEVDFVECSVFKADKILEQLLFIYERHTDLAIDVTGGNDAALFAAGMFCNLKQVPAFTYSRKNNCFYNILNADFAEERVLDLKYSVEDIFLMAGGDVRKGRVDNKLLENYIASFNEFFDVFLKYKHKWPDAVTFFIRISQGQGDEGLALKVDGNVEQKADHGRRVTANKSLLNDLVKIDYIRGLKFNGGKVSFSFKDQQIRAWLRDVGSALELYMYKACVEANIFNDVVSSCVVDWDGTVGHDSVSNEIDVVATRGVTPIFISCKACEVKTEALNELAILRDRFGGKGAKACIVTTENCNSAARHRAAQLQIAVIDIEELEMGNVVERLKIIMKTEK